jgi:hypothetical protein
MNLLHWPSWLMCLAGACVLASCGSDKTMSRGGGAGGGGSATGGGSGAAGRDDASAASPDSGGGAGTAGGEAGGTSSGSSDGGAAGAVDSGGSPSSQDASPGGPTQVIVSAGPFDRTDAVVSFPLPAGAVPAGEGGAGRGYILRDTQGNSAPMQVDGAGVATFILPSLKAGAQATFVIEPLPSPPPADVTAVSVADGVNLQVGAKTALHYQTTGKLPAGVAANYLRGGYIHPLYTPNAVLVTDDYPPDHRHHHGIWSAWVHSTFQGRAIDFWNMGMGTAKVDFEGLDGTWSGPVHAGLRTRHVFVDETAPQPTTALREHWVVTLYKIDGAPPYFLFDLDSTQETATTSPLMLDLYYYGGFGIRGHATWRPADFLTSDGLDRLTGDGKPGRWCHIGGMVNGAPAGYAILGHPSNFRAPQPMRLNPTDPFMSYAPVAAGAFSIDPGTPYRTRFRFVASDGPADKVLLDRIWNDFATPPTVVVRVGS